MGVMQCHLLPSTVVLYIHFDDCVIIYQKLYQKRRKRKRKNTIIIRTKKSSNE